MTSPIVLTPATLGQVAEVHLAAFPESALSRLGPGAVRRYYEWQLTGPHECHAVGAVRDGRIVGFCFGGVFRGAMRGFVRRNAAYLVLQFALRPWLILNRQTAARVRMIARVFARPVARAHATTAALGTTRRSFAILAIATHPAWERRGVGRELMMEAERVAAAMGFGAMHLTVRADNPKAISFYEGLGWSRAPRPEAPGLMTKSLND